MDKRPIRVGVIGAGAFGRLHASKVASSVRAALSGIHDVDPRRAFEAAALFGAPPAGSIDELIADSDAVIVASPALTHAAIVETALAAGRHVYVEKPIACTVAEARRIAAQARCDGLHVGVGHQERFVFAALGALDCAERPIAVEARRMGPRTGRGEDVSVVFDLMIHDLDLIAQAFGGAVLSSVSAEPALGSDDAVRARLRFDGGRGATVTASRRAARRERVTTLIYEDGAVEIDFLSKSVRSTRPTFAPRRFDDADPRLKDALGFGLESFFGQILGEAGPRPVSAEDGARAVALAEAVETARTEMRDIA